MYPFLNYVLWTNLKKHNEKVIISGLRELYESMMEHFNIIPETKFDFEDMFLKIGKGFYLIRVPGGYSPGDISGMYRHKYLDKDEEVMAVLVSRDYYLPHHCLINVTPEQLSEWHSFPDKYQLIWKKNR